MLFIKKSKLDVNMELVDKIVKTYFDIVKSSGLDLSGSEISELLRFTLCRCLSLNTKGYSLKVEKCSEIVYNKLNELLSRYDINKLDISKRQGLLEACVHCLEMSRKRACL